MTVLYQHHFYFWVSLLVPSRDTQVIGEFVRNGYAVKALVEGTLIQSGKNKPVGLLALDIQKDSETKLDPSSVQKTFAEFADKEKISYYSCICTTPASCCWRLGNIDFSSIDSKTSAILKIGTETNK